MRATPFDPSRDLAPIPFSASLCRKARELKVARLLWEPQVGCFVWLPTWHQARRLLLRLGVENAATAGSPEEEFLDLYERILDALRSRNA